MKVSAPSLLILVLATGLFSFSANAVRSQTNGSESCILTYTERYPQWMGDWGWEREITIYQPPDLTEGRWGNSQRLRHLSFQCSDRVFKLVRLDIRGIEEIDEHQQSETIEHWSDEAEISRHGPNGKISVMFGRAPEGGIKLITCMAPIERRTLSNGKTVNKCKLLSSELRSNFRTLSDGRCSFYSYGAFRGYKLTAQNVGVRFCGSGDDGAEYQSLEAFSQNSQGLFEWFFLNPSE